MRTIFNMLDSHYMRKGRYPSEEQFQSWLSKTMKENNIRDIRKYSWGGAFSYSTTLGCKSFILVSMGKDGQSDTKDDMIVTGL